MEKTVLRAPHLADWVLAHGKSALSSVEVAEALGVPQDQVSQRLHAPRRRGEWVSPVQGLWIPVPPQYRTWGAPPGIDVIDAMMRHTGVGYYVGWLTAASLYGASHQAPQVFQVAVDRQLRDRVVGRTRFEFMVRRNLAKHAVRQHVTRTGYVAVSSIETTMLDVMTDVRRVGGLDNAATVIVELAEHPEFNVEMLSQEAHHYSVAAIRRIGWVLDRVAERDDVGRLAEIWGAGAETPSRLNPTLSLVGKTDAIWGLALNDTIEVDV